MRKLLLAIGLFISLISSAQVTIQNSGSRIRYVNGVYVGTKLDAHFGAADSGAIYTRLDSTLMFKYKGTARALMYAANVGAQIHDSLYAVYQLKAGTSAGARLVSNSGTVVSEWGLGGSANMDFHGFAGYDANRSSSYTNRSFVDKGYADSLGNLKQAQLNGTGFVKASGTTISYDNSTYLTGINASLVNAVGTISNNTTGNAATATLAANSTLWNGYSYVGLVTPSSYMMAFDGSNWGASTPSQIRTFLGLGSYALRSSGLAELSGAAFTGALSGTSASFSGTANANDYNLASWKILDWNSVVAKIGGIASSQFQQLDFYTNGTSRVSISNTALTSTLPASFVGNGKTITLTSATSEGGAGLLIAGSATNKNWFIGDQYNVNNALEFTPTTTGGGTTIGSTPVMYLTPTGAQFNVESIFSNTIYAYKAASNTVLEGGGIYMAGGYTSLRTGTDNSFNIDNYNGGSRVNALKIAQSGAATFSSSVTAANAYISNEITAYSLGLNGSSGGWARHYSFIGSTGTNRGGFGAFGSDNTLSYYYIGNAYNDYKLQIDASTGRVTVGSNLQIGNTTYNNYEISNITAISGWNQTVAFKPLTVPGSGSAKALTKFATNTGGGTTQHDVQIDGILILGDPYTPSNSLNVKDRGYFVDAKYQYGIVGMQSDAFVISTDWYSGAGGATPNILLKTGGTTRLDISSSGIAAPSLAGTGDRMVVANSSGVLSTQAIPSGGGIDGTYSPTLTGVSNITSISAATGIYTKVDSTWHISIPISVTPSAVGTCQFTISIPSTMSAAFQRGYGVVIGGSGEIGVIEYSSTTSVLCRFTSVFSGVPTTLRIVFDYSEN